jgi:hypothetical protein
MWDEDCNSHLFTAANLMAAQTLLDLLVAFDMNQILPKGILTLEATVSKNLTRPGNVFCLSSLVDAVLKCGRDPGKRPPCTDHMPIATTVDVSFTPGEVQLHWKFRAVEWDKCETEL